MPIARYNINAKTITNRHTLLPRLFRLGLFIWTSQKAKADYGWGIHRRICERVNGRWVFRQRTANPYLYGDWDQQPNYPVPATMETYHGLQTLLL